MSNRQIISPKLATYGSAIILTLLTLSVFAYSKDQGPESAVRRYHQAIAEGDMESLRQNEVSESRYSKQLSTYLVQVMAQSQRASLGRVRQNGRFAYVDVIYPLASGRGMAAMRFVVEKPKLRWQVNPDETVKLLSRMSRFE
ncbi:MAG: hypothetical protein ACKVQS_11045 [Fimbriimonadaceae bacterium]